RWANLAGPLGSIRRPYRSPWHGERNGWIREGSRSSVQERTRHKTKARRSKLVFAEHTWNSGANNKVHSKRDYSLSSGLPESKMQKIMIGDDQVRLGRLTLLTS